MIKKLWVGAVVLLLAACQQNKEVNFKNGQQAVIKGLEAKTMEAEALDTALVRQLTNAYLAYADSLPQDSLSPYYLSKAADLYKVRRETALYAINTYNMVLSNYPEHPLVSRSLFMMGFTFDEVLGDKQRAVKSYTYFLEQYPEHPLAEDARTLLAMAQDTGTSDLEIIKNWEANNAQKQN